eukprot:gene14112-5386_t
MAAAAALGDCEHTSGSDSSSAEVEVVAVGRVQPIQPLPSPSLRPV